MKKDSTKLITKTVVDEAGYATAGQYAVLDTQIPGFCLRVGKRTKTFTLRREFKRDGQRVNARRALGLAACKGKRSKPLLTVAEARKAAYALIAHLGEGIDPKAEAPEASPQGMTFAEAVELFEISKPKKLKGRPRAPKTQDRYAQFVRAGYLATWMDRPLHSITRKEAYDRHRALTQEVAAGEYLGDSKQGQRIPERNNGMVSADNVFRWFRAVWNRAMRADETLPVSPTINVEWHNAKAARSAISTANLAAWHRGVMAIPNPIRRDYLLFALFSGMRRRSIAEMRWADVDFERKVLHVPKPKGGEERAFYLPLSDYLLQLLAARKRDNPELVRMQVIPEGTLQWVFPAYGKTGHITEPREEVPGVPFTIHDLRRTFVTTAESLDIPLQVVGVLVNHRQPGGSMTARYVTHEVDRLRGPMQQITDYLLRIVEGGSKNVVSMRRKVKAQ